MGSLKISTLYLVIKSHTAIKFKYVTSKSPISHPVDGCIWKLVQRCTFRQSYLELEEEAYLVPMSCKMGMVWWLLQSALINDVVSPLGDRVMPVLPHDNRQPASHKFTLDIFTYWRWGGEEGVVTPPSSYLYARDLSRYVNHLYHRGLETPV